MNFLILAEFLFLYASVYNPRDLEERKLGISQIYAYVILHFLLKAAAFDVLP